MEPALVVMAAGMGSRYGGLKQLDPVGPSGEVIMDYSIYDALQAGFKKVVFIIRKDIEAAFREHIGQRVEKVMDVEYAFQELDCIPSGFTVPEGRTKPWGTAHALLVASQCIQSPFGVINADDFYGRASFVQLADYLRHSSVDAVDYALVGFRLANTLSENGSVARGICALNSDHFLQDVEEYTDIQRDSNGSIIAQVDGRAKTLADDTPVSMNMWGFTPAFFDHGWEAFRQFLTEQGTEMKSECYIPSVVDGWIKHNQCSVQVIETSSSWFGVTYSQDKPSVVASVQKMIDQGIYPSPLWK